MFKPKATEFDGVKYKSATEARWALFFTALGLDFEYEPEIRNRYTPDFRIKIGPAISLFFEVKATNRFDAKKMLELSRILAAPFFLLCGTPICQEVFLWNQYPEFRGDCGFFVMREGSIYFESPEGGIYIGDGTKTVNDALEIVSSWVFFDGVTA